MFKLNWICDKCKHKQINNINLEMNLQKGEDIDWKEIYIICEKCKKDALFQIDVIDLKDFC